MFEPGITNLMVTVPVMGDVIDEATEQFFLVLSSPTNALAGPAVRARVTDDDPLPAISINDVTVTEGRGGTTNYALFNVAVVGVSDVPLFVNYSTADQTAASRATSPQPSARSCSRWVRRTSLSPFPFTAINSSSLRRRS
jgi:hypothetical protein